MDFDYTSPALGSKVSPGMGKEDLLPSRVDVDRELAATGRIKSGPYQVVFDVRPQPVYQRQIRLAQEIQRRCHWIVGAAFQGQVRLALGNQRRWQHGLEYRVALPAVPTRKA